MVPVGRLKVIDHYVLLGSSIISCLGRSQCYERMMLNPVNQKFTILLKTTETTHTLHINTSAVKRWKV